jgi:outer membrane protein insertion porin family/translocation and assembly module TamA
MDLARFVRGALSGRLVPWQSASLFRPLVLFLLLLGVLTGCTSIPQGKSGIDEVNIRGADEVDESDTLDKIATAETPKFLGVIRGVVYDYEIFDRFVLQRDLARIERFYRARGFYDARARAGQVIQKNNNHVRVEIIVEEGPPIIVTDLEVVWPKESKVPDDVKLHAYLAAKKDVRPKKPFDEDGFASGQDDVKKAVTDAGFAYAKVTRNADVDIANHTAVVTYTVEPDLPAKFGTVTIQGLDPDAAGPLTPEIPEDVVRRTINIHPGEDYSTADIDSASSALTDLEVFASVDITPQLSDPPPADHVVNLIVKVQPSKLRSLRLGGGVELDEIQTNVHGVVGWEDHNFLGGLRDLTVSVKPAIVLFPLRIGNFGDGVKQLLPAERLHIQLKQPAFIEARTSGFITPDLNVFPILVPGYNPDSPVIGYIEPKTQVGINRYFLRKFYVQLSHTVQVEYPFAYRGALDPNLQVLTLSYPDLTTTLDFTDNRVHPHEGIFIGNDFQIAGVGGVARDVKIRPEVRVYVPLHRRITWASRATVGFLYPLNYGKYNLNDSTNNIESGEVRDLEIRLFRGFYSGGPTSNRGYAVNTIAPHITVPFLNPTSVQQETSQGCFAPGADPSLCKTPIGGLGIWELSTEFRFQITKPISVATFVDASDVSPEQSIRLNHPHLSTGAGVRYDTPVGPLRVDIGYRIPGLQHPAGDPLDPSPIGLFAPSTCSGQDNCGIPIAISAGIGEAF